VTPTSFPTITKPSIAEMKVKPNMLDYERFRASFRWEDVYRELDWLPGGWLNMAHEAIDRHAYGRRRDKVAMIWEGVNGEHERHTFGQLKTLTSKFANVLKSLGVERGDRVFILMDRLPELYVAFLGTLKVGAIAGPLSSAFGPDPIKDRLKDSGAKVLVTQPDLRRRITGIIPELFDLQHIIVVNKNGRDPYPLDMADLSYEEEMGKASADFEVANTSQYDYATMHYTSGTTDKPKGAVHRHQAVVQQYATGKWALDLHDNDIYWCTADPGSVTGTSYGMLAPWTNGITQVIYEGRGTRDWGLGTGELPPSPQSLVPSPSQWYEIIQRHRVTVWYTDPTAIRMLMEAGDELPRRYNLSSLRFMASAGEPLDPEAVTWGVKVFGMPFHDTWQQAETGAMLCANYACMDVRPGSMGRSTPGVELGVIDDEYNLVGAGVEGNLAARPGWPSMFHTYWNDAPLYNSRFRKGWYITGERARMDSDGYFWLARRAVESTDFTDDTD
jgi:acetyl-CoA synthetase